MSKKENLADRLRFVLYQKKLSQAEAARRSGISQQAFNYIIKNDLEKSKLSSQIAVSLEVNPEWLIYGKGNWEVKKLTKVYCLKDENDIRLVSGRSRVRKPWLARIFHFVFLVRTHDRSS